MSKHDDLFGSGHGHRKHHEPEAPAVHIEVPLWAEVLYEQQELILKELREMKQSTTALVTAFNDLSAKIDELESLAAQANDADDEAAKTALLKQMTDKIAEVKGHLPTVADTATTVAQAPADTGATIAAS